MREGIKLFLLDLARIYLFLILGLLLGTYVLNNGAVFNFTQFQLVLILIVVVLIFLERLLHYMQNWKYIIMPYSLKLFSQPKNESKETKVFLDRFVKKKGNTLYYKNRNAIDTKAYTDNQNEILHFFNLFYKPVEINITPHKTKAVKVELIELPKYYEFKPEYLKVGHIFYGISKDGLYHLPIGRQTHLLSVGESGSGKSNLLNCLVYSILLNEEYVDYTYMIDLKGVELYKYSKLPFVKFIDNVENILDLLKELKQLMNNRFKAMQEIGDLLFQGKTIFVLIDEIGTISAYPKAIKDEIYNLMIEIFQKGRAAKIIFLVFAQKIDSTNLPSNVLANIQSKALMKTDSDFNINNTIGTKESIEDITRLKVSEFNRGRMILKDGITSKKSLVQVPFIDKEMEKSMDRYFSSFYKRFER